MNTDDKQYIDRLEQHARETIATLTRERDEARAIIAQHNLCHDLHGKVGAREFTDGCTAEQRKLYGCAPDADALTDALAREARLREALEPLSGRFQVHSADCVRRYTETEACNCGLVEDLARARTALSTTSAEVKL